LCKKYSTRVTSVSATPVVFHISKKSVKKESASAVLKNATTSVDFRAEKIIRFYQLKHNWYDLKLI